MMVVKGLFGHGVCVPRYLGRKRLGKLKEKRILLLTLICYAPGNTEPRIANCIYS